MPFGKSQNFLILSVFFLTAPAGVFADNQNVSAHDSSGSSLDFANGLYARKMYGPAISEYDKFIKSNPASPDISSARFRLADSFYFMKDYPNAVSHFKSFITDFPDDKRVSLAAFRLGAAEFYQGNLAVSKNLFIKVAFRDRDPNLRSGALFYLAKAYEALNKLPSAVTILTRLVAHYPQTEYAAYAGLMLGDIYSREKKSQAAISAYKFSSDHKTPVLVSEEASIKIADIYLNGKDTQNAAGFYNKVYDAYKNRPAGTQENNRVFFDKSLRGLFYCHAYTQNLEGAVRLLEENKAYIEKSALKYEVFYILANLGEADKKFDFAIKYLDRIETDPKADPEFLQKAVFKKSSMLGAMGKNKEAIAELEKAERKDPKNAARVYFEQAELFRKSGNNEGAATAYQAVLKGSDNPYSKPALYSMATVHSLAGKKEEAKKEFLCYADLYPKDEDAEKALLQAVQVDIEIEDFSAALKDAKKFIQGYPKSQFMDVAYYKTGMALTGLKKFKEASGFFRKVITEYAKTQLMPESLYGAAVSLENAGEIKEAVLFYEKLLKEYPEHSLLDDATLRLGYLYVQQSLYDKAADLYRGRLLNQPNAPIQPKTAFWLIRYLLDHSRYDEMKKVLDVLPQRFPKEDLNHEINFFMGENQMGLNDTAKAAEFYKKSIDAKPDGEFAPHAYLGLGIAASAQGDSVTAEKNLSEAAKYDSEVDVTLRARFEIASLKLRAGNLLEAANAFMLVAVLYDDEKYCPLALFKANECFAKLGKIEDSEKAAEELKTRYPGSEWAKKLG